MSCQEVAFAHGKCGIEIREHPPDGGPPTFIAHMFLLDDSGLAKPLVLTGGKLAEIHARTEELALNTAVTFLEGKFGALSEYAHACPNFADARRPGKPIVIDRG